MLVNFEAVSEANLSLSMEVWYVIKPSFTLYPPNELASRFTVIIEQIKKRELNLMQILQAPYITIKSFQNLIVNTNFDAKEKMSRNYVNAIGPFGEPVLIYSITSGLPATNISVVWVNPVKIIEDASEIALEESLGVRTKNFPSTNDYKYYDL